METSIDDLVAASHSRRRLPEPPVCRLLRQRARLSQADIAAVLGVDRATVSRWETGGREPRGQLRATYIEILDRLAIEGVR